MIQMGDKFIILVGDGMGDYPIDRLGGLTPLEAARTPNLDRLVRIGTLGIVQTIPAGMQPGSDVANMSLLGYDPVLYHTGRGPLEAASIGVRLEPDEVAFRCNLVFLSRDKEVVHVEEYVRPFRISKVSLKASSVLELPPHTIYRTGTQVGDQLEISALNEPLNTPEPVSS